MLKIGMIGAGIAKEVHLPAISMSNYFEVEGIVTSQKIKKIQTFSSVEDLLEKKRIDLFLIATPPSTHFDLTKKIIHLKKPIYYEKPFCLNLNEAKKLGFLLKKNKIKHCIGYQFRYELGLKKLKGLIKKNKIGKISKINIDWLTKKRPVKKNSWKGLNHQGAGVDMNYLTHCLDYLKWLTNFKELNVDYYNIQSFKSKIYDDINLYMTLDRKIGVSLRIINNLKSSIGHKIQIIGDRGALELFWKYPFDGENTFLFLYDNKVTQYKLLKENKFYKIDTRINAVKSLWDEFYKSLFDEKIKSDVPDSKHAVQIHKYLANLKLEFK